MVTILVVLVVLMLLLGAGDLSLLHIDVGLFPGGLAGLAALVVIALLVTRRL